MEIIFVINVLTFYLYDKVLESYHQQWEKKLLEEKVLMYENQFQVLQQSREKVRALRHDMKNHLRLLSEFSKTGKADEISSYIEGMEQFMIVEEEIVATGNESVDAILNYMLEKAKRAGADIDVKVSIPNTPICSSFDLNVLLGNLLDNAIEGVAGCREKKLYFAMKLERGVLHIAVENTFDGQLHMKQGQHRSGKKNDEHHGIGLQNVRSIVDKYGGQLKIEHKEGVFMVDAILFINPFKYRE